MVAAVSPDLRLLWQRTLLTLTVTMTMMSGSEALDLSEVPAQLRERILHFHRVLDTPDNFSVTPEAPPEPPRTYPLAGLQEAEEETAGAERAPPEPLELQEDLFRFAGRISPPLSQSKPPQGATVPTHNILQRMHESQVEIRLRLRKEWQQFLRWRSRQRRRRRMRRRIMKMLQKKLEKRFGPLPPGQWRAIQNNSVFRTTKRIIRKKIRRLMRRKKRKKKKMAAGIPVANRGGGRKKKKTRRGRKRKKGRKKQRQG